MTSRKYSGKRIKQVHARMEAIGEPCHICGLPIDYSLGWYTDPRDGKRKRHPYALEWDHDVPHALGGDDSFDNARPAHRICNQRKGMGLRGRHRPPETASDAPSGARPSRDWRRL